ncbi:enolase [Hortaea werneckii]|nr:enolase [Hortaea werneckii]
MAAYQPTASLMPSVILSITASQRLDSRGKPTVQVRLTTGHGHFTSIVPSGASKGDYEAVELRDGDRSAYQGNGVLKAVHNVNAILGPAIVNASLDPTTQLSDIDRLMVDLDGTEDKSKMGANAILAISMAAARAGASGKGVPLYRFLAEQAGASTGNAILPVPFMNVLNGGDHSGNTMAFQEFMIAPTGATSFEEAVRFNAETYACLKTLIIHRHGKSAVVIGDEGGFAPPIYHPTEALDLLVQAITDAGHEGKIKIGIDPASQSFEEGGVYDIGFKTGKAEKMEAGELASLYHSLLARYPIVLLEDPFGQDDWSAWSDFNKDCAVELVGDDLLATNVKRIQIAQSKSACNSLLLKVNQIGSITEAIEAANKAFALGWSVFVSHRSGETTDDFIADLTVGLGTGHLKSGAPCRGERVAKYNRLMDIEEELRTSGNPMRFAGEGFRNAHGMS